jgi:VanZ family protein
MERAVYRIARKLILRWVPAAALMGVIFIASGTPAGQIPTLPRGDDLVKKGGHALGYALLSLAYLRGIGPEKRHGRWMAFLLALLFALTDEYHQQATPGRTPSLMDVSIDSAGALVGLILHRHWPWLRKITHANSQPER